MFVITLLALLVNGEVIGRYQANVDAMRGQFISEHPYQMRFACPGWAVQQQRACKPFGRVSGQSMKHVLTGCPGGAVFRQRQERNRHGAATFMKRRTESNGLPSLHV